MSRLPAADLHAVESLIPSGNHLSRAEHEVERSAIFRRVEHASLRVRLRRVVQPAGVVDAQAFAFLRLAAGPDLQIGSRVYAGFAGGALGARVLSGGTVRACPVVGCRAAERCRRRWNLDGWRRLGRRRLLRGRLLTGLVVPPQFTMNTVEAARAISVCCQSLLHAREFDFEDERGVRWDASLSRRAVRHARRHVNAPLAACRMPRTPWSTPGMSSAGADREWIRTRAGVARAALSELPLLAVPAGLYSHSS